MTHSRHREDDTFARVDEAIAMATMYTANHLAVKAIAALTESGGYSAVDVPHQLQRADLRLDEPCGDA